MKTRDHTPAKNMHEHLWTLVQQLPGDYEPYGQREREGSDCSCGCKHFLELAGKLGLDWGVCANSKSARCGLLTFEHQGCAAFESKRDYSSPREPG